MEPNMRGIRDNNSEDVLATCLWMLVRSRGIHFYRPKRVRDRRQEYRHAAVRINAAAGRRMLTLVVQQHSDSVLDTPRCASACCQHDTTHKV